MKYLSLQLQAASSFLNHLAVVVVFLVLSHLAGYAQYAIVRAASFPTDPKEYMMFHDTVQQRLWTYEQGKWNNDGVCVELIDFGPMIFLRRKDPGIYSMVYIRNFTMHFPYYYHSDSVMALGTENSLEFYNVRRQYVSQFGCKGEAAKIIQPVQVKGMDAFCVPQYVGAYGFPYQMPDFRNFGMLGSNGQWLIAPQYDARFEFKNGLAKVLYYGKELTINEDGEVVD